MASEDGTKCKTCFGGPRVYIVESLEDYMLTEKILFQIEVWFFTILRDPSPS